MRILLITVFIVLFISFVFFYLAPAFRGDIAVRADFYLGPVRVHLYGLILVLAILVGFFLSSKFALVCGIERAIVEEALPWIIIFGFAGARLYYVIFSWNLYRENFLDIFKVWQGGLSIYGAILGGLAGACIYAKRRDILFWNFLDTTVLGLSLGQAVGRFGNFFNQEAFGQPTSLPWKMYVSPTHRPFAYFEDQFFHPTFLYESLWDLAVFFLLFHIIYQTKRDRASLRAGFLTGAYFILYSLGRFFIEGLRLDSIFIDSLRLDQITSLVMMAIGALIIVLSYKHARSHLEDS